MNKFKTQIYISNIENGRMNPTLSCPPVALCKGGQLWKKSLMRWGFPVANF